MKIIKIKYKDLPPKVKLYIDYDGYAVQDKYDIYYGAKDKKSLQDKLKKYEY